MTVGYIMPSISSMSNAFDDASNNNNNNISNGNGRTITTVSSEDTRQPLFLGDWKRSIPYVDKDFAEDQMDEPHFKRRIVILNAHPEVTKLYGHAPITILYIAIVVITQVGLAYVFGRSVVPFSWTAFVAAAYFIGGTMTTLMGVIFHEACHHLIVKDPLINKILGIIGNIGLPVPISCSFRRYHLEHHTFQGVTGRDPDLPMKFELSLIKGNTLAKLLWIALYPFLYAIRGAVFGRSPRKWELINIAFILSTDCLIYKICGPVGFGYMLLSTWFGYSFHPGAAHFIQEHYTFMDGQETYSYYGWMNKITMNVGYHIEHHDFPQIPWTKLPAIKAIAPEFYEPLTSFSSWYGVLWKFITCPQLGPQSRIVREYADFQKARKYIIRTPAPATGNVFQRNISGNQSITSRIDKAIETAKLRTSSSSLPMAQPDRRQSGKVNAPARA